MSARNWTLEQRQRQSEAIKRWKPWEKSTGPKSPEGKGRASGNAFKGGQWLTLRALTKLVNAEVRRARKLVVGAQQ